MAQGERPPTLQPPPVGKPRRPPPRPIRWNRIGAVAVLALILLGVNWWTASRVTREAPRVRVPYSPVFLDQVRTGNVASITSKGSAVQGTFKQKVRYPPKGHDSRATTRFKTEIPTFANADALSKLLVQHDVVINAQPLDTGVSWWESLLFGFGPTLLFLGLFLMLLR